MAAEDETSADSAMWIGLADLPGLADLERAGVGAVPLPISSGAMGTTPVEIDDAYAISAMTRYPEAAWQWIEFLLARQRAELPGLSGVPARPGVGLRGAPSSEGQPEAMYRFALVHARRADPLRPEEYLAQQALRTALTRVVNGELDVESALREAQAAVEKAIGD
jgi:ABC-type glycerol-3-phosphate transport system substrate-binding protein